MLPLCDITVRTKADATLAAGLVVSTNPAAGSRLTAGSVVAVVVSSGPAPPTTTPNLPDGVKRLVEGSIADWFKRSNDLVKRG